MPSVLITLTSLKDYPGCIPTEPIARHLVPHLLKARERVRILAEGKQAEGWPGDVEVTEGSITRPSGTPTAFEGIQSIFLAGADPTTAYEALRLAKDGGAAKVVNLSSHGPDFEIALPPESWHWLALEVVVERSGMAWCHLVPSLVMAVTLTGSYPLAQKSWRDLIRSGQPIKRPFAEAKYPFIHEKDLAEIVARALRNPHFNGQKVHVSGKLISDLERGQILREVTGKEIRFEALRRDEAMDYYKALNLTQDESEYLFRTAAWFAENSTETYAEAESLLGRPLSTFAEWSREHSASFA